VDRSSSLWLLLQGCVTWRKLRCQIVVYKSILIKSIRACRVDSVKHQKKILNALRISTSLESTHSHGNRYCCIRGSSARTRPRLNSSLPRSTLSCTRSPIFLLTMAFCKSSNVGVSVPSTLSMTSPPSKIGRPR